MKHLVISEYGTYLGVEQGEEFHGEIESREKRRNFSRYGLPEGGKRHYRVRVEGENGHGIADCVIETDSEIFLVEYKLNPHPGKLGHRLQLAGYAAAAEKLFGKKCEWGFLTGQNRSVYKIQLSRELKDKAENTLREIRETLATGIKPPSGASAAQCGQCEYLNFCNDRL